MFYSFQSTSFALLWLNLFLSVLLFQYYYRCNCFPNFIFTLLSAGAEKHTLLCLAPCPAAFLNLSVSSNRSPPHLSVGLPSRPPPQASHPACEAQLMLCCFPCWVVGHSAGNTTKPRQGHCWARLWGLLLPRGPFSSLSMVLSSGPQGIECY